MTRGKDELETFNILTYQTVNSLTDTKSQSQRQFVTLM